MCYYTRTENESTTKSTKDRFLEVESVARFRSDITTATVSSRCSSFVFFVIFVSFVVSLEHYCTF